MGVVGGTASYPKEGTSSFGYVAQFFSHTCTFPDYKYGRVKYCCSAFPRSIDRSVASLKLSAKESDAKKRQPNEETESPFLKSVVVRFRFQASAVGSR